VVEDQPIRRFLADDSSSWPGTKLCVQVATPLQAPRKWFDIPLAMQMGWTNSPAFFCTTTEATQQVIVWMMALTHANGDIAPHAYKDHCASLEASKWANRSEMMVFLQVFVDDFIQAIAGPGTTIARGRRKVANESYLAWDLQHVP
jgi:hypothetical protein